jgi:single-strand DNA-binding protein
MLNHITIQGRLTRDPELRTTSGGVSVTSFTLAVERDYQRNGEDKADFIDCVAFRQQAEFVAKYFSRGMLAIVAGSLHIRKYQDRNGQNRSAAEISVDKIYFGESKRSDSADRRPTDTPSPVNVAFEDLDDGSGGELPF